MAKNSEIDRLCKRMEKIILDAPDDLPQLTQPTEKNGKKQRKKKKKFDQL